MLSASEALEKLKEGNQRFVSELRKDQLRNCPVRRSELLKGQEPFAIILGCSDSRVPAELVFDRGLGDLFVIRVAGNVVAPSQIGSVEFAAASFGTRLVVVMGHTFCGAITETISELVQGSSPQSPNLKAIVDRVKPSILPLMDTELKDDVEKLTAAAVRSNIRASANHLRNGSKILEDLIANHGLLVVGAEYDLASGVVDFFDGLPS